MWQHLRPSRRLRFLQTIRLPRQRGSAPVHHKLLARNSLVIPSPQGGSPGGFALPPVLIGRRLPPSRRLRFLQTIRLQRQHAPVVVHHKLPARNALVIRSPQGGSPGGFALPPELVGRRLPPSRRCASYKPSRLRRKHGWAPVHRELPARRRLVVRKPRGGSPGGFALPSSCLRGSEPFPIQKQSQKTGRSAVSNPTDAIGVPGDTIWH